MGAIGVPSAVLGAGIFAFPIFYNVTTKFSGAKKVGMCLVAGAAAIMPYALGAAVGSSLTGRTIGDSGAIVASSNSLPAVTPSFDTQNSPVQANTVAPPTASNPILAKVEAQNNAPVDEFNAPRNGGTTTLAQKCEALREFSNGGSFGKIAEVSFQIGFEHELGSLSTDQACAKVGVPQ